VINKFDNQLASKFQKLNNPTWMTIIIQVGYQSLNTHTKKIQKKKIKIIVLNKYLQIANKRHDNRWLSTGYMVTYLLCVINGDTIV